MNAFRKHLLQCSMHPSFSIKFLEFFSTEDIGKRKKEFYWTSFKSYWKKLFFSKAWPCTPFASIFASCLYKIICVSISWLDRPSSCSWYICYHRGDEATKVGGESNFVKGICKNLPKYRPRQIISVVWNWPRAFYMILGNLEKNRLKKRDATIELKIGLLHSLVLIWEEVMAIL